MKKLIALFTTMATLLFATAVTAAPPTPSQCASMTFDHVIVNTNYGVKVNGTNGRDLIFAGGGSVIDGKGGDDCIVVSAGGNLIKGGDGNDVIILNGGVGNGVNGGAGDNTCYNATFLDAVKNCIGF